MRGSQIEFFADSADLAALFEKFDAIDNVVYTRTLSKVNEDNVQFHSATELLKYLVTYDDPVQGNVFMITLLETEIIKREIRMSDGSGVKFSISQIFNPDAIEILLGGEAAATTIVVTKLRTTGETPLAKDLFKKFKKVVTKETKRVGDYYYVAPNALCKLDQGWRLAPGIEYSEKMDVKRPPL